MQNHSLISLSGTTSVKQTLPSKGEKSVRLKRGSILLVVCMVLMVAPAAMATTATIQDTTLVQQWNGSGPYGGGSWVDVIGASIFETTKIDVVFSGADVKFQIHTNMPLTGDPDFGGVPIADLALDLNHDGTFEKGIVLTKHGSFDPGLYSVNSNGWLSSVDFFQSQTSLVYGGLYDQSAPKTPLTQIKSVIGNATPVSVSQSTNEIDVTLSGVNSGGAWNNLSLFWGTGICSNDGIAGQVPVSEPGTMLLLGFGFFGLGVAGRKIKK